MPFVLRELKKRAQHVCGLLSGPSRKPSALAIMKGLLGERGRLGANNLSADLAVVVYQQDTTMAAADVVLAAPTGFEEAHQHATFVLQWLAERTRLLQRQSVVQLPKDMWRCPEDRIGDDVVPKGTILGLQDGDFEVAPRRGELWNKLDSEPPQAAWSASSEGCRWARLDRHFQSGTSARTTAGSAPSYPQQVYHFCRQVPEEAG